MLNSPHLLPALLLHSLDKNQFIVTQNTASVMASNRVGSPHILQKRAEFWSGPCLRVGNKGQMIKHMVRARRCFQTFLDGNSMEV